MPYIPTYGVTYVPTYRGGHTGGAEPPGPPKYTIRLAAGIEDYKVKPASDVVNYEIKPQTI
jgi:hypothetical protein